MSILIGPFQIMRSSYANLDGRWWFGFKRWPSTEGVKALQATPLRTGGYWPSARVWFIGLGPIQIRWWPKAFIDLSDERAGACTCNRNYTDDDEHAPTCGQRSEA